MATALTSLGESIGGAIGRNPAVILLGLAWIAFGLIDSNFLSTSNILSLLVSNSVFAVAATGLVFVFLTGGIDLSIGEVVACSAVISCLAMVEFQGAQVSAIVDPSGAAMSLAQLKARSDIAPAALQAAMDATTVPTMLIGLVAALLSGAAFGLINGIAVGYYNVIPFIATLATQLLARGLALVLTQGVTVAGSPRLLTRLSTSLGIPFGDNVLPWVAIIPIVVLVLFGLLLGWTSWGRDVVLIGSNPEAARYAGKLTKRVLASVYLLSGVLAGLAGYMVPMTLGAADPKVGAPMLLPIVGAITIGGIRTTGGYGTMFQAAIGILLFATLINGMNYLHVNLPIQQLLYGGILVAALAFMGKISRGGVPSS